jgi:uncharacterized protein YyaL (SSP411 family)
MPNRLAGASSPYLLQHADNPVDWYEWGDEAFAEARRREVPVLLSVGYATCHWCHVMAHESFEDEQTAHYMNEHFVSVKVDREERPDVDRVYMDAVQAMSGRGGWPMTVFLTPDGEPFFAGTYFPKEQRGHYPSFMSLLGQIAAAWQQQRDELVGQAARLTAAVRSTIAAGDTPGTEAVTGAVIDLIGRFDWEHGGFGGAPKFPQAPNLELVARALALGSAPDHAPQLRGMLTTTLDAMAAGGIYDHLGGGFSRYSVDERWLVPHFEKMLYDNALLARLYLRSWQLTGIDRYRVVARETLDYMLRDLADPDGGFWSGEDADSEGEEGTFYVWSWDELAEAVGDEVDLVAAAVGATRTGNFEGSNVLHRAVSIETLASRFGRDPDEVAAAIDDALDALRAHRSTRVRPSVDDKIVTAWNGLALRAFAEAGAILEDDRYRGVALRLARFCAEHLRDPGGRLARTWRRGALGPAGFCDDHASLAVGMLTMYAVTGDVHWFQEGRRLVAEAVALFADPDGGFFSSGSDADHLIARPKNLMDNPTPSDNSSMAEALQMLAALTGSGEWTRLLDGTYRAGAQLLARHPSAVGHLAAVLASGPPKEVALVGPPADVTALSSVVWERFRPDCVLAPARVPDDAVPLLAGRMPLDGKGTAFVCRDFVCDLPVTSPSALRDLLER